MLAGVMLLLAGPSTAAAQWSASAIGVAEYDTDETLLLLAGVSASLGAGRLTPVVGVQGSFLSFQAAGRTDAVTIRPYAGLRSGYDGGSFSATVGYAFANRDDDGITAAAPVAADRGSGVVASAGLDHWGTGGPLGYQLLGSYNLGSESYWTRGRVTTRLGEGAGMRAGGELALLGGDGYRAWQPGAVLEWHNGSGRILGLGAGVKLYQGGGDAVYFRVEGVLPLVRR